MSCAATKASYDELCTKLRKISHLEGGKIVSILEFPGISMTWQYLSFASLSDSSLWITGAMGLMGWDEQTFMPTGAEQ